MGYIYLIIALILLAALFNGSSSPSPDRGVTGKLDGFFYYKGFPVRKCRDFTMDDDGNFWIDGELLTDRELDTWYRTLTHSTKDF